MQLPDYHSNNRNETPLRNIAKYNPQFWDDEEIRRFFIARRPLLEYLLNEIRAEPNNRPAQHHLLVGQRGSGKSTLLKRLAVGISDDPALSEQWIPLSFPEEQYNISGLNKLWLNCLDALGDFLDKTSQHAEAAELDQTIARLSNATAEEVLNTLKTEAQKRNRKFLLLVDNLDLVLSRIGDESWGLREVLQSSAPILLVGASAALIESTFNYDAAFYDFFYTHKLNGLNIDETKEVLRLLAVETDHPSVIDVIENEPARLATMHQLSGGNPRTVVLLFNVLREQTGGDVLSDLKGLLDDVTPLYKVRFEELPEQAQQILDALAIHWHPMLAGQLAEQLRLKVNTVSAQLTRLIEQGVVEKVASSGKRNAFQVAERFFNVWYLMRASRRMRQKLLWLVQFLKAFHTPEQLREYSRRLLLPDSKQQPEYLLAVAQCLKEVGYQGELLGAIEHKAVLGLYSDPSMWNRINEILDLKTEDQHLNKPLASLALRDLCKELKLSKESAEFEDRLKEALLYSVTMNHWQKFQVLSFAESIRREHILELLKILELERDEHEKNLGPIYYELRNAIDQGIPVEIENIQSIDVAAARLDSAPLRSYSKLLQSKRALNNEDPATAHELSLEAISIFPDYAGHWLFLGSLCHLQINQPNTAKDAYHRATELAPTDHAAWYLLGNLYQFWLAQPQRAKFPYQRAAELEPQNEFLWRSLGSLLHYDLHEYRKAEEAYKRAMETQPATLETKLHLGKLYQYKLNQPQKAETCYREAIEINPADADAWTQLGYLFQYDLKRQHEAETAYGKALELDSENAKTWHAMGHLLFSMANRHSGAEAALRKSIKLDPSYPHSYNALAWLLFSQHKKLTEALKFALRACELTEEKDPWLLHTLSCLEIANDKSGLESIAKLLDQIDDEFAEKEFANILRVFGMHIAVGHLHKLIPMLEGSPMAQQLLPIREALNALASENPRYLNMIAPEIREPAEQIIQKLNTYSEWWLERSQQPKE